MKIEKLPSDTKLDKRERRIKWPFKTMEVGDVIKISGVNHNKCIVAAKNYARINNKEFDYSRDDNSVIFKRIK